MKYLNLTRFKPNLPQLRRKLNNLLNLNFSLLIRFLKIPHYQKHILLSVQEYRYPYFTIVLQAKKSCQNPMWVSLTEKHIFETNPILCQAHEIKTFKKKWSLQAINSHWWFLPYFLPTWLVQILLTLPKALNPGALLW